MKEPATTIADFVMTKIQGNPELVRNEMLERWADERAVVYEKLPVYHSLTVVNEVKSRENPGRVGAPIDEENLDKIKGALESGIVVPAVWGYKDVDGRLVILDGWHRYTALTDLGFTHYYVYLVLNNDKSFLNMLGGAMNSIQGLGLSYPVKLTRAVEAYTENSKNLPSIAEFFAIRASTIETQFRYNKLTDRLGEMNFDKTVIAPHLGELVRMQSFDDETLGRITALCIKAGGFSRSGQGTLNAALKRCGSSAKRFEYLDSLEASPEYQAKIKQQQAEEARKARPPRGGKPPKAATPAVPSTRAKGRRKEEIAFESWKKTTEFFAAAERDDQIFWAVGSFEEALLQAAAMMAKMIQWSDANGTELPPLLRKAAGR